jgi:HD superfamily phosphohydrolase
LLTEETPSSIYAAIVSSQFDADRLDYMRRDRFMTGVQHGGFDLSWLLANLDVGKITLETDNESFAEVDSLVLKGKALEAGESYVLGLFHLYFSVYFHKATRSAEAILTGLIRRIGELCGEGDLDATGLEAHNPIVRFIREPNLDAYLRLDDFVVWGSLSNMSDAKDEIVRELATRLLQRRLFKAIEISEHLDRAEIAAFRKRLQDAKNDGRFGPIDIFEDKPSRSPYKIRGYGTPEALSKIYVKPNDDAPLIDLRDCSAVVKALEEKSIYRVFVRDGETQEKILAILQGK